MGFEQLRPWTWQA